MDFLSEVEKKLDLPPGEKAQVIRELRSHYEELKGELVASGMDADVAAQEASRKLGDPSDVVSRLQAIHCRATWRTAVLTALPLFVTLIGSLLRFPLGLILLGNHASRSDVYAYHIPLLTITALSGLIFLAGSIRELLHGRRPMWLATWLAVSYRELSRSVYGLHQLTGWMSGHPIPQIGVPSSAALAMLAVGIIAMIVFRRSAKWFLILGGWTILIEVIYLLVPWAAFGVGWSIAFSVLADVPLIMAIALGLFARHPYGNTAQTSLFLFALFAGTSTVLMQHLGWYVVASGVLPPMVIVATVLAYARSSTWRLKLAILAGGIVGTYLAHFPFNSVYDTVRSLFMLLVVILVPMLFERRWSDRKPEFVR